MECKVILRDKQVAHLRADLEGLTLDEKLGVAKSLINTLLQGDYKLTDNDYQKSRGQFS
jgi:hypothetical protein